VLLAQGPAAVPMGERDGDVAAGAGAGAGAAAPAERRGAARPGDDRAEVSAQGGGEAVRFGGGVGGGPAAVPGGGADPRPPGGPGGAPVALVPAEPARRRPGRRRPVSPGGRGDRFHGGRRH